ncbi:MAG: hypothetical protein JO111_19445 [Caulobacteraceae bacterium]|nr:hypothetical protein [Caulobacteraceae bacterium]
MPDRSFEAQLERRFADTPTFPDADLFASRVAVVLDRGWGVRRLLIGGLGLAGGLIGGIQILRLDVLEHIGGLQTSAQSLISTGLSHFPKVRAMADVIQSGASMDAEVLWMSGGLAILAIGLLVTRTFRDI